MRRRSRRCTPLQAPATRPPAIRDRQARVKVTDNVWQDFRLLTQSEGVGEALGRLVTREVERWRIKRIRDGSTDDEVVLGALERARELQAELATITAWLERLAQPRHPPSSDGGC
jgi:hypothetical protein